MRLLKTLVASALAMTVAIGCGLAPSAQAIPPGPRDCVYVVNAAGNGQQFYYGPQQSWTPAGTMYTGEELSIGMNTTADHNGFTVLPDPSVFPYGYDPNTVWCPYYSDAAPSIRLMDLQPNSCSADGNQ